MGCRCVGSQKVEIKPSIVKNPDEKERYRPTESNDNLERIVSVFLNDIYRYSKLKLCV